MALSFPASPSDGDVYTNTTTGVKYIYNATDDVWKTQVFPTNTDYLQLTGGTLTGNLSLGTNDLTAQDINSTTLTTTGAVTVGNGLTVSAGNVVMSNGAGIDFSAAGGSASTNELLDNYEEGTWTPVLSASNATDVTQSIYTGTYAYQNGFYTRIGRAVTCSCYVQLPSSSFSYTNGVTSTNATSRYLVLAGLPYVVSSGVGHFCTGVISGFGNWTGWSASYTPAVYAQQSQSYAFLTYAVTNGSSLINASYLAVLNANLLVSFTYFTDQ